MSESLEVECCWEVALAEKILARRSGGQFGQVEWGPSCGI